MSAREDRPVKARYLPFVALAFLLSLGSLGLLGLSGGEALAGLPTGGAAIPLMQSEAKDVPAEPQFVLCNTGSITIPDSGAGSPYPSIIGVSGQVGTVTNITVTLSDITHSYPDDVDILLVGPLGQTVVLMSDAGGGLDINNVTLRFQDGAPALPDSAQITAGLYAPTNYEAGEVFPAPAPAPPYGTALSVFNGTNPNGNWRLYVVDDLAQDSGTINGGWCLGITMTAPPTPTPAPTVCLFNIPGSITTSDPVQLGRIVRDPPTNCQAQDTCQPMDNAPRHYDAYSFINDSGTTQCVNVTLDNSGCAGQGKPSGAAFLDSAGYVALINDKSGGFSPTDVCSNFLADIGTSQPPTSTIGTYSFLVRPDELFTIVVNEATPGLGCAGYLLTVSGCLTPVTCLAEFTDVPRGSTFHPYVRCLACNNILGGYEDGTFRPGNPITRGQLAKVVSNAAGFNEPVTTWTFQDVPVNSTFWEFVERMAIRGIISGYSCGGPGEPCVPPENRHYFRPGNNATRGQISKIVSEAAGFSDPPGAQRFEDVPPGSTFYDWIQRLANRGIMGGYGCGGVGEPCVPPENRPYFRPSHNATRGQVSKIVSNTFFPSCSP